MLLPFHLPKWQYITHATICSHLQCNNNENWQAPVILSASCPFPAQHDCCTHKLKHTHSLVVLFLLGHSRRLNFICWHFGTLCSFFLLTLSMNMEQTECSETSANTIKTLGNHPKERIWRSQRSESFKSRNTLSFFTITPNSTPQ